MKLVSSKCNYCGEGITVDKHGYTSCPSCGAEGVPPTATNDRMIRQSFEMELPCARSKEVSSGIMHVKSKTAGSKNGKNYTDKKGKMQKPSVKELYVSLCGR